MRMLIAGIHFQFPEHGAAQWVARQHALDRTLDDTLGGFIDQFLERNRLQATGVTGVTVIYFRFCLIATM